MSNRYGRTLSKQHITHLQKLLSVPSRNHGLTDVKPSITAKRCSDLALTARAFGTLVTAKNYLRNCRYLDGRDSWGWNPVPNTVAGGAAARHSLLTTMLKTLEWSIMYCDWVTSETPLSCWWYGTCPVMYLPARSGWMPPPNPEFTSIEASRSFYATSHISTLDRSGIIAAK